MGEFNADSKKAGNDDVFSAPAIIIKSRPSGQHKVVGTLAGLCGLSSIEYKPLRFRLMDLKENLTPLKAILRIIRVVRFVVLRAEYGALGWTEKVGVARLQRCSITH